MDYSCRTQQARMKQKTAFDSHSRTRQARLHAAFGPRDKREMKTNCMLAACSTSQEEALTSPQVIDIQTFNRLSIFRMHPKP